MAIFCFAALSSFFWYSSAVSSCFLRKSSWLVANVCSLLTTGGGHAEVRDALLLDPPLPTGFLVVLSGLVRWIIDRLEAATIDPAVGLNSNGTNVSGGQLEERVHSHLVRSSEGCSIEIHVEIPSVAATVVGHNVSIEPGRRSEIAGDHVQTGGYSRRCQPGDSYRLLFPKTRRTVSASYQLPS
ncbi:hypothetical protein HYQ46_007809 [Verticillium longisporum]|nr:hypothetical protein HYQ46_007809 [Verticillium longisporum]